MEQVVANPSPITWVDVARRLATITRQGDDGEGRFAPPNEVLATDAYWSGLNIIISDAGAEQETLTWIERLFPTRLVLDEGNAFIKMDAPNGMDLLPLTFEVDDSALGRSSQYRPSAALQGKHAFDVTMPERPVDAIPMFAFHSVKGGVGRTTTAIALARHLARVRNKPVLIVDADFEAPGLSYLFASRKPESAISFEDMLGLVHADPSADLAGTVSFIAERLTEQRVGELIVMPVKRSSESFSAFAIRPEHIVSARKGRPFLIVDILRDVATALGCGAVVIDLRAGLVEIAMQVLSDPSVERCFVTTTSGQSVQATCDMLRALGAVQRATNCSGRKPAMVVNQIPAYLLSDRRFIDEITGTIEKAAISAFQATAERARSQQSDNQSSEVEYGTDSPLTFVEMPHSGDLIRTLPDWENFLTQLDSAGFSSTLTAALSRWPALDAFARESQSVAERIDRQSPVSDRQAACRMLGNAANKMFVADTAPQGMSRPLVIPPLRRLGEDFLRNPPIAVIEGAKGTGKTMMARFLMDRKHWRTAIQEMEGDLEPDFTGPIVPVYASSQSDQMITLISERAKEWSREIGSGEPKAFSEIRSIIQSHLAQSLSESEWADLWLDMIAWTSGVNSGERGAWRHFLELARSLGNHPIALFEGLEEVIEDPYADPKQAVALRALIVAVPLRLREQTGRPVGITIFVRGDMVEAVIRQNLAQFRATYRNYSLTWSTIDILELVIWMAHTSGAVPNLWSPGWRDSDRRRDLEFIWGWKLGPESSREARSTEWVLAVLTDLNGRLTARDLVRFIARAADLSANETTSPDIRLLVPAAMRRAVSTTSEEKVKEYPTEVTVLKEVFEKIKRGQGLETPLDIQSAHEAGLTEADLSNLVKYGIFFEEEGAFEVPELFRIGLGMRRKGARPNIISLTRRALDKAQSAG